MQICIIIITRKLHLRRSVNILYKIIFNLQQNNTQQFTHTCMHACIHLHIQTSVVMLHSQPYVATHTTAIQQISFMPWREFATSLAHFYYDYHEATQSGNQFLEMQHLLHVVFLWNHIKNSRLNLTIIRATDLKSENECQRFKIKFYILEM